MEHSNYVLLFIKTLHGIVQVPFQRAVGDVRTDVTLPVSMAFLAPGNSTRGK